MIKFNWDILLSSQKSTWAFLASCPEKNMDNISLQIPTNTKVVVRIIQGKRCSTKKEVFQEWAAGLQFPYYFGNNWDAFNECINDLEWLPAEYYVIVIMNADRILSNAEEDFQVLVDILKQTADTWFKSHESYDNFPRPATPFHIVFHCKEEKKVFVKNRLKKAGVDIDAADICIEESSLKGSGLENGK